MSKFLVIPQLSVKRPDEYMSVADSGYSMVYQFKNELVRRNNEVTVLMPRVFDEHDTTQVFNDFQSNHNESIHWYERLNADYRLLRYGLDQDTVCAAILAADPDVVWNHIPEAAALIRACLDAVGSKAKLVSMGFWLDLPIVDEHQQKGSGFTFAFDQFSGFLHSDVVGFTSISTLRAFFANWSSMFGRMDYTRDVMRRLEEKTHVFDFGYSHEELLHYWPKKIERDPDTFNIFFPNRLTAQGYTHAREFIEACQSLIKRGMPLQVFFTNPGKKMKKTELVDLLGDHVWCPDDDHTLTRAEYFEVMSKCDLGVSLFTTERYGGCASREYAAAGLKVLWPYVNEYARLIDVASPRDYVAIDLERKSSRLTPDMIARGLFSAYDTRELAPVGKLAEAVKTRCDFSNTTDNVLATIAKR